MLSSLGSVTLLYRKAHDRTREKGMRSLYHGKRGRRPSTRPVGRIARERCSPTKAEKDRAAMHGQPSMITSRPIVSPVTSAVAAPPPSSATHADWARNPREDVSAVAQMDKRIPISRVRAARDPRRRGLAARCQQNRRGGQPRSIDRLADLFRLGALCTGRVDCG